jgi:hypothetical protein
MEYCNKAIRPKSKAKYLCKREKGHSGKCDPFSFIRHLLTCNGSKYAEVTKKSIEIPIILDEIKIDHSKIGHFVGML